MVSAERLTRVFDGRVAAVSDATLEVQTGEAVAIAGPSGAGKSTLLALLATMLRPTSGRLRLGEVDAMRDPVAARRRVCWPVLPASSAATVSDFLGFLADARGVEGATVSAAIERVAIDATAPLARATPALRARLAVATVLVSGADVVLVDTPFDRNPAEGLWREVLRDLRRAGTTLLFSIDPGTEPPPWCDRGVRLDAGRIVDDRRLRQTSPDTAWQVIRA